MSTGTILLILGIFYFAAQGLAIVFRKTRIPDVLILVALGIVLGPLFKVVTIESFGSAGQVLTVMALAVVLFESGVSLKLKTVWGSLPSTLSITIVTLFITILVVAAGSYPLFENKSWALAILAGAVLSGTSSAVVIPMVGSLGLSERPGAILVLESALTDVLCIILTFALIGSIETGTLSIASVGVQIASSLSLAGLVGVGGGFAWLFALNQLRKLPNSAFTTIAFALILYGFAELLGLSGAIASLAFGLTLSNGPLVLKNEAASTLSDAERAFFGEIVFLLKTFFFIYLGISISFEQAGIIFWSLLIVVPLYFLRLWITRFFLSNKSSTRTDAKMVAVMVPKGLAAAVLSSVLVQRGIPGAETIQAIVFAVVTWSILLTAVLVPLAQTGALARYYDKILSKFGDNISGS